MRLSYPNGIATSRLTLSREPDRSKQRFEIDAQFEIHVDQFQRPSWSLTQCFFCCMGGFAIEHDSRNIRVSASQILEFFEKDLITWPEPLDSQINDRTKADWIMKMLALTQVLWFVTQLIGRAAQHLPITTLELFTAGIIICGILMYAAWWQKPFDVRQPILLRPKAPLPVAMEAVKRINLSEADSGSHWPMHVGGPILGFGFGAMHLFGWNFHFPSEAERYLWRVSSTGCAALPLVVLAGDIWSMQLPEPWDAAKDIGITCMYGLFRIYILIEMFAGLRSVPVDVYKTPQWSQYFPAFN